MSCDEMNYGHGCYRYGTFAFLGRGKRLILHLFVSASNIVCAFCLEGMDKDIPVSTTYFERACQLDFAKGCHNAAIASMQGDGCQKNVARAVDSFKKACSGGIGESCLSLWSAYFHGHQGELMKDGPKALEYASKACDLEVFQGCVNASLMCRRADGVPLDVDRSKHFLQKANDIKKRLSEPGVQFGETHKNLD